MNEDVVGFLCVNQIMGEWPPADMLSFFRAIWTCLEDGKPASRYPLTAHNLYRGYVGPRDFVAFERELDEIEPRFREIRVTPALLRQLGVDADHTCLDPASDTLAALYRWFFDKLRFALDWTRNTQEEYGFRESRAIRTAKTSVGAAIRTERLPEAAFFTDGEPLWLRKGGESFL